MEGAGPAPLPPPPAPATAEPSRQPGVEDRSRARQPVALSAPPHCGQLVLLRPRPTHRASPPPPSLARPAPFAPPEVQAEPFACAARTTRPLRWRSHPQGRRAAACVSRLLKDNTSLSHPETSFFLQILFNY
ncbi:PREDICTED: lysine-rich arabinogalactan protein 19-like [Lipotes vexillifer]|uniref:Lysine-rich arabinogalactan protein 19-like n=1 Tax=Lipotes vexillifer TaxID=118797 RepID=A0A340WE22_LIPVE|nr:PREDICTED: lysine-rich arabinogalactan protein 19-like [Lipotes vexillifer]